jgi:hypothetical protein
LELGSSDCVRGAEEVFAVGEEGHVSMRWGLIGLHGIMYAELRCREGESRAKDGRQVACCHRSVLGLFPMAGERARASHVVGGR